MTAKLSSAAEAALINTPAREGGRIPATTDSAVRAELRDAYLIGSNGLTRRGVARRQRILSARLEAFGEL